MSHDLSERISAYAVQIEEDAEHVTVAELGRMIGSASEWSVTKDAIGATPQRRTRVPAWIAAGAAGVLVLIAVGVPILIFGGGDESIVTVEPSTTVPSNPGEVNVYNPDLGAENPWSGMVVGHEGSPDDEYIMLTQPTGPVDLNPGDGTGMYPRSSVYVHEEWGMVVRPPGAPELTVTLNNPSSEAATKEVLWLAWRRGDAQAPHYEIQAALEHDVTEGFRLHPECYVIGTLEHAAALTAEDLVPVAAWKVGPDYATFEETDPSQVKCEASITEWRYEHEFEHPFVPRNTNG
jgi:hypothetical protein